MKTKKLIIIAFLFTVITFAQTNPALEFVGNANIQKSLTNGDEIPANTGIGVIYRENLHERFKALHSIEIELSINIASTVDTLETVYDTSNNVTNKSAFGNSILLPSNSGQAFGFRIIGYLTQKTDSYVAAAAPAAGGAPAVPAAAAPAAKPWLRDQSPLPLYGFISGFNINFNGSNRNWYDSDSDRSLKVSNLSMYAGLFHEFVKRDPKIREKYSITLGAGITGKLIGGDIAQEENSELRKTFLGSTRTSFLGFETNLGLRLKNIKAEVHIPFFRNKDKIPGLSGVQPTTFIGFVGGFSLDLN
jgi:hypothetical protein